MPLKHVINSLSLLNPGRVIQKTNSVPSLFFASKSIAEIAGVLVAPKKPLTPFFRYLQLTRPKILSEHPKMHTVEVVKEVAKRWETVDQATRQKLEDEYKKERDVYEKLNTQYKAKLTPEMVETLKMARQERQESREKRQLRKRNKELDKPKKIPSAFLRFLSEQRLKSPPPPSVSYQVFLKQVAEKWATLSDADKKPYFDAYHKEATGYKVALEKWEAKMLKDGNLDVVRSPLLLETPLSSSGKATASSSTRSARSRKSVD